jgi:hypothetical protein
MQRLPIFVLLGFVLVLQSFALGSVDNDDRKLISDEIKSLVSDESLVPVTPRDLKGRFKQLIAKIKQQIKPANDPTKTVTEEINRLVKAGELKQDQIERVLGEIQGFKNEKLGLLNKRRLNLHDPLANFIYTNMHPKDDHAISKAGHAYDEAAWENCARLAALIRSGGESAGAGLAEAVALYEKYIGEPRRVLVHEDAVLQLREKIEEELQLPVNQDPEFVFFLRNLYGGGLKAYDFKAGNSKIDPETFEPDETKFDEETWLGLTQNEFKIEEEMPDWKTFVTVYEKIRGTNLWPKPRPQNKPNSTLKPFNEHLQKSLEESSIFLKLKQQFRNKSLMEILEKREIMIK